MKIFQTIDGLFTGTRYLTWGIALLGMIGSVFLFIVNIPLGFISAAVFLATFFLAIGVVLLLTPRQLVKGKLAGGSKLVTGVIALVIALVIMGIVWFSNGGFPAINLIFA